MTTGNPRQTRWWVCDRKIAHPNKVAARHEAWRMGQAVGGRFDVYHCPFCRRWHVGHRTLKQNKRKRKRW